MSKLLGERLIEQGLIDERQLELALKSQLTRGGTLGTCLIELDMIDERRLGPVLSEVFGVPCAEPWRFEDIPDEVLQSVPGGMIERFRLVPFRMNDRTVDVCMADPNDIVATDQVAFTTGLNVTRWVAPEARVRLAMERYYDIPRPRRFIEPSAGSDPLVGLQGQVGARRRRPPVFGAEPAPVEEEAPPRPTASDMLAAIDSGASVDQLEEQATGPADTAVATAAAPAPGPNRGDADPFIQEFREALDQVGDYLCTVDEPAQVATAVLELASMGMKRTMFLGVDARLRAGVWNWRGFQSEREPRGIRFDVTHEPLFELPAGAGFYRGPLSNLDRQAPFYWRLGVEPPGEVLILPLYNEDRLVAILYGDGGPAGRIRGATEDYRRLAEKVEISIGLLGMKRKLRSA